MIYQLQQLVEGKFGHGAIPRNRVSRGIHRFRRGTAQAGIPFDWSRGFDVENGFTIPRKNQGQSFSCGAQALSYFLTVQNYLKGIQKEVSAKSIYANIAYPGGGTTSNSIETWGGAHGGNLELDVPSYQNGQPPSERFMTDKSWITSELIKDAMTRAGFLPVSVPIDMESIAQATRDNNGCIMEISGQNNGTWLSPYPLPPKNKSNLWNHFMFPKGARTVNGVKEFNALNSWGEEVGFNGVQCFNQDYIDSGFILDVFTFVPDYRLSPIPTNTSIWAEVVNWFNTQVELVNRINA